MMPLPDWWQSDKPWRIADCLEVMRGMPDKCVDLVLTDPPYGIGDKWVGGSGSKHGWSQSHVQKDVRNDWDFKPPKQEVFKEIMRISKEQIIWGGNYFNLPPSRCWLIWNKPERGFTLAEAEMAWTSFDNVVRVFDHPRHIPNREHPTTKPIKLFEWCLSHNWARGVKTVFDPFIGSGTTLLACRKTGRVGLGCEINPDYEPIIRKRCLVDIPKITEGWFEGGQECE